MFVHQRVPRSCWLNPSQFPAGVFPIFPETKKKSALDPQSCSEGMVAPGCAIRNRPWLSQHRSKWLKTNYQPPSQLDSFGYKTVKTIHLHSMMVWYFLSPMKLWIMSPSNQIQTIRQLVINNNLTWFDITKYHKSHQSHWPIGIYSNIHTFHFLLPSQWCCHVLPAGWAMTRGSGRQPKAKPHVPLTPSKTI